jgi:hypothetical protein
MELANGSNDKINQRLLDIITITASEYDEFVATSQID